MFLRSGGSRNLGLARGLTVGRSPRRRPLPNGSTNKARCRETSVHDVRDTPSLLDALLEPAVLGEEAPTLPARLEPRTLVAMVTSCSATCSIRRSGFGLSAAAVIGVVVWPGDRFTRVVVALCLIALVIVGYFLLPQVFDVDQLTEGRSNEDAGREPSDRRPVGARACGDVPRETAAVARQAWARVLSSGDLAPDGIRRWTGSAARVPATTTAAAICE
jgi:hypothetical protein